MDIQSLVSDIESLCDNEAADGSTSHLRNVRGTLEQLASYIARREQAIEARREGFVDTAMGLEDRANAQIGDITNDGDAMVQPGDEQDEATA